MNSEDPILLSIPPKSGIYIIKCGKYYKIGLTRRLDSRISCLRISNPFPIKLIFFLELGHRRKVEIFEKSIHKSLEEYHHRGEWFILPNEKVVSIINYIKNYGK